MTSLALETTMTRSAQKLHDDALAIWRAGVDAAGSERLVEQQARVKDGVLQLGDAHIPLATIGRIAVVGAGKAGAGMVVGLEQALGPELIREKQLSGWVNVPDDCALTPTRCVHLHGARPAGLNEPTQAGVAGTLRILEIVRSLAPEDLCICLLSGGGSALMPAPVEGISLADKQAVTRHLSAAGANIEELNTVRKQLSQIKGGGLSRACRAGRLVTLIISDVIGDPLDVIASGPTVLNPTTSDDALDVLSRYRARAAGIGQHVFQRLEAARAGAKASPPRCEVTNLIVGNNAVAVEAAGEEAKRRGYSPLLSAAQQLEGAAEDVGGEMAARALALRNGSAAEPAADCLISGGEPVVTLVPPPRRGRGGRNQQLVLAALAALADQPRAGHALLEGISLLSGGTDGEDGPTDAAGAIIDQRIAEQMRIQKLSPNDYLRRNDAYPFFATLDALIKTGPTHTNVCDLRVVTISRDEERLRGAE